ncbi:unnamed protein product [Lupinus luteus]|uniref:Uncharacterized protein n=1 Tax=Lupinus luteus TaxID=3873 RepID=A0AAV1X256_LUPLU
MFALFYFIINAMNYMIVSRKASSKPSSSLNLTDNRSFVEAVIGSGPALEGTLAITSSSVPLREGRRVLSYSSVSSEQDWLLRCMVGRTVRSVVPSEVSALLKMEGILSVRAHVLDGDLILLSPVDGEDV